MRERESFLKRLEDRLSRVSGWLAQRRHGSGAGEDELHGRTEAIRREVARARRSAGETAREDLARVRKSLDDLRNDYDVPPPHYALRPEELQAFRRYLATVARLEPALSNLDDPRWDAAHDEYERAWAELESAFDREGPTASP
jgi:hypothetical protein